MLPKCPPSSSILVSSSKTSVTPSRKRFDALYIGVVFTQLCCRCVSLLQCQISRNGSDERSHSIVDGSRGYRTTVAPWVLLLCQDLSDLPPLSDSRTCLALPISLFRVSRRLSISLSLPLAFNTSQLSSQDLYRQDTKTGPDREPRLSRVV